MLQYLNRLHFYPYSNELEKLSKIYQQDKFVKHKIWLKGFRFSPFQTLLIAYALVAILRFLTIAYLYSIGDHQNCLETYYKYDLLMSVVNFRRNLNEYVHLCFAAFAGFTVYTHYLNYYALSRQVVDLLFHGHLQQQQKSFEFGKTKHKILVKKKKPSFTEAFAHYEQRVFLVLYFLFGK